MCSSPEIRPLKNRKRNLTADSGWQLLFIYLKPLTCKTRYSPSRFTGEEQFYNKHRIGVVLHAHQRHTSSFPPICMRTRKLISYKSCVSGLIQKNYETWCLANTQREKTAPTPKKISAAGMAHIAYSIPLFICSTDRSEMAST